jgi:hypothetical protein
MGVEISMNYVTETSEEFKEWSHQLALLPNINTFCVRDDNDDPVLNNGKVMVAEGFKLKSESLGEVEQYLMSQCNEHMKGKRVWVRVLPYIIQYADEEVDGGTMIYEGRARIVAAEVLT